MALRRDAPEGIVRFLEDLRRLHGAKPAPSCLISMKLPEDLLATFQARAMLLGVPYQAQIERLMAASLRGEDDGEV